MPDRNPILDYAQPDAGTPIVPALGVVLCSFAAVCAAAILVFGVWWIVTSGVNDVSRGAGVCIAGALTFYLSIHWYGKARRALERDG